MVLLAAVLLAGCGGADRAPQTREGFISAADGVCEDLFSEFAAVREREPQTPQEIATANEELADTYEKLADRLARVRLPEERAARRDAQAFVASVRGTVPLLEELRAASARFLAAAGADDRRALAAAGNELRGALDRFRAARARSDRRAIDLGLTFCGNLG